MEVRSGNPRNKRVLKIRVFKIRVFPGVSAPYTEVYECAYLLARGEESEERGQRLSPSPLTDHGKVMGGIGPTGTDSM